jgi:hypothetical protein
VPRLGLKVKADRLDRPEKQRGVLVGDRAAAALQARCAIDRALAVLLAIEPARARRALAVGHPGVVVGVGALTHALRLGGVAAGPASRDGGPAPRTRHRSGWSRHARALRRHARVERRGRRRWRLRRVRAVVELIACVVARGRCRLGHLGGAQDLRRGEAAEVRIEERRAARLHCTRLGAGREAVGELEVLANHIGDALADCLAGWAGPGVDASPSGRGCGAGRGARERAPRERAPRRRPSVSRRAGVPCHPSAAGSHPKARSNSDETQ